MNAVGLGVARSRRGKRYERRGPLESRLTAALAEQTRLSLEATCPDFALKPHQAFLFVRDLTRLDRATFQEYVESVYRRLDPERRMRLEGLRSRSELTSALVQIFTWPYRGDERVPSNSREARALVRSLSEKLATAGPEQNERLRFLRDRAERLRLLYRRLEKDPSLNALELLPLHQAHHLCAVLATNDIGALELGPMHSLDDVFEVARWAFHLRMLPPRALLELSREMPRNFMGERPWRRLVPWRSLRRETDYRLASFDTYAAPLKSRSAALMYEIAKTGHAQAQADGDWSALVRANQLQGLLEHLYVALTLVEQMADQAWRSIRPEFGPAFGQGLATGGVHLAPVFSLDGKKTQLIVTAYFNHAAGKSNAQLRLGTLRSGQRRFQAGSALQLGYLGAERHIDGNRFKAAWLGRFGLTLGQGQLGGFVVLAGWMFGLYFKDPRLPGASWLSDVATAIDHAHVGAAQRVERLPPVRRLALAVRGPLLARDSIDHFE